MITIEKYQLENLLRSNEFINIIFPLLNEDAKDYAKDFLRKEKEEKRKALNEKRKMLYRKRMGYFPFFKDIEIKDNAKDFLRKEKVEKRKALNENRRLEYHQKMDYYKKVFGDYENEK